MPEGAPVVSDDACAAEALDWFIRLQAEAGQPATVRGFREWLEGDPRREQAFAKVAAVWGAPEFLLATRNIAKETGLVAGAAPRRTPVGAKATAVAIMFLLIFGFAHFSDISLRLRADYVTATGERRSIALSDGSTITLNTGSAVSLDFTEGGRGVTLLQGEAFFDVRSDAARPFRVTGRYGRVTVKGTAFAVRLEPGADSVVLSRGAVDVSRLANPIEFTSLKSGEGVSVTPTALLPVRRIDSDRSLEWVDGRISFSARPFGEVLDDLRRYYPGRIIVVNGRLERIAVSGSYRLDDPGHVISSLAEAAGGTATVLPGGFIVLR